MADERTASRPFFRCRREWAKSSVPASVRAVTSRDHERLHGRREILRQGVLGEHVGLSEHVGHFAGGVNKLAGTYRGPHGSAASDELRMTGWLEIHRAKLTAGAYEIAFSLIDLKDLRREARKGNVLPSSSGSTFPRRLNATGHLLRGAPLSLIHFAKCVDI